MKHLKHSSGEETGKIPLKRAIHSGMRGLQPVTEALFSRESAALELRLVEKLRLTNACCSFRAKKHDDPHAKIYKASI